ncbi:hypothetical protein LB504_009430 [Fusarium proliferatum]|nr:hypothetical protein LB504_009430 [Fusarium proliferatum]
MPLQRCAKQPRGVRLISRLTKTLNNVTYQNHGRRRLRKARLEQLKAEAGGSGGGSSSQEQQQQRQQQQNDARQHILNQILHPEAADRLGRIRLVKEERAADIENRLITLAQTGQLRQKVTEAQLKELLNAMSESKEEEKIVVSRRKAWDDDDDLDL